MGSQRKPVLAVGALLAVELVVFGISTLPGVRGDLGFDPWLDGWLQGGAYVTAAVLCTLRPVYVAHERRLWGLLAAALWARALAFVLYLGFVRVEVPQPYPSVADAGWLAMCVLVMVALMSVAREHFARVSTSLLIDGLVGALATAGVALALLHETLLQRTAAGIPTSAVVTNLAYPVADVALLVVILGVLVAFRWHPPAVIWLLGAAVVAFAVVDGVFLYRVTAGTWHPGSPIAALSLIATAAIAYVAWWPGRAATVREPRVLPGLVAPALFALVCLGLLVYASVGELPLGVVVLAAAGLLLTTARAILTLREAQRLSAELRVARDEAEHASSVKSDFLSGMSHELRTPLNSMLGFAQLLELDATDAQARDHASRIVNAGRHLVALIDDLLDIARLERGALRPDLEPVLVGAVVREALELAEPDARERGVAVEWDDRAAAGIWARGDYRRLRQVLLNLLSNAVKYNRPDGRVTVTVALGSPDEVLLTVSDTGPGIAPAQLERLFQPFERLPATSSDRPGTGLGLAISKGLAEEMGGTIRVDSVPGEGSAFTVALRRSDQAATGSSSSPGSSVRNASTARGSS